MQPHNDKKKHTFQLQTFIFLTWMNTLLFSKFARKKWSHWGLTFRYRNVPEKSDYTCSSV